MRFNYRLAKIPFLLCLPYRLYACGQLLRATLCWLATFNTLVLLLRALFADRLNRLENDYFDDDDDDDDDDAEYRIEPDSVIIPVNGGTWSSSRFTVQYDVLTGLNSST